MSRDETVPHNHMQALFIYNLEPSYMGGSHWVATYAKNGIINYFDSFGMPPFQEIVDHARKKNLILLHQNNQIQNINTTTCGYFCLYFLNEMSKVSKGRSYYDLLKVFNIHNTMKNEKYVIQYYMKLYCRSCKFYTTMEYDIYTHNFICQKCDKLLIGSYGYEILEFDDAGDLELYVTKDMFVYLHQNGYFKQLMKIYNNRIWISTGE